MRESQEREIGALKVTTVKLPAMRGSRLRFKLLKLIGPAAGAFRGRTIEDLGKLDLADVLPIVALVVSQLDDAAHDALALEILACTSVVRDDGNGKLVKFDLTAKAAVDQAFDGDVDAMWAAAQFALEVNLGGFFAASAGRAQAALTPSG